MNRTSQITIPFIIALIFLSLSYPFSCLPVSPKGIMVRPLETIKTEEDIDVLVNLCETYQITNIFLMVKQDIGPESGLVFYNSSTIPRVSDFDVLSRILEKAHNKNIKVYAWLPLLYDRWAAEGGFRIEGNWVCPLQSISYYSELMEEMSPYRIDGILLDYLRFSDDFAASERLRVEFGQEFGYNMNSVELSLERERGTQLWNQWISYRDEVLSQFLEAIMPEAIPVGVTVTSEDLEHIDSDVRFLSLVDFVAVHVEDDPAFWINKVTLSTEAQVHAILPNNYISEVRRLVSESSLADLLIFSSDTWDESAFKRIKKAQTNFTDVRTTTLSFIDFYNEVYNMEKWRSYEVNTVILPAGHVFWTYFKYEPYREKWSAYTEKYNRDYVDEMLSETRSVGLFAVLRLDIQSEEYVNRNKDAASITYHWGVMRDRVCLTELVGEPYKTEFFEMAKYLADNYEAEALLIGNISYLEDCFCTDCLESYIAFMADEGVAVEDWPRADGEIDVYDSTIGEWKTRQITRFLHELREYLRESNKELWVEVPVSEDVEYASSEYGLHLPDLEPVVDRIVLMNLDTTDPPRIENIVRSLPTVKKYILNLPVTSETPPARQYLLDSLKTTHENGIDSVGVYPQSALTDSLWGAFYIAYAYRLALTDDTLIEIYRSGDYGSVIAAYDALAEEKKEEERQVRERARQNIKEAGRAYSRVLSTLEEARQVDLSVAAFEIDIRQSLESLSAAEQLFMEGSYESAEERGKTVIIEFSTLDGRINNLVREERLKRITSGVLILVVFLLIMMYVRFKMRRRK